MSHVRQFKNASFENIDINGTDNDDDVIHRDAAASVSGPWLNRASAYSKKVTHVDSNNDRKLNNKYHIALAVGFVTVFLVGLAVGFLVGIYGVAQNNCKKNPTTYHWSATQAPSSKTKSTPASTVSPCNCDFSTYASSTPSTSTTTSSSPSTCSSCVTRDPVEAVDSSATSLFAPLTEVENNKVIRLMKARNYIQKDRSLSHNRTSHVYLHPVNKAEALKYLDQDGEFPGRYAKVHVIRGGIAEPDVMEYRVGPLNESDDNVIVEQLRTDGEIDINRRPHDNEEIFLMREKARSYLRAVQEMLVESFGTSINIRSALLPTTNFSDRVSEVYLHLVTDDIPSLRILPFSFLMHHAGLNTDKWYASDFYYLSQGPFESAEAIQKEYDEDRLNKFRLPDNYAKQHMGEFSLQLNTSMPKRVLSDIPPPRTYEPQGPRYTVRGSRILWMDWEFDFTVHAIKGPGLFDVRFKQNRIAYEISLQDITLIYGRQTNGAGPPVLSDTVYTLGNFHEPRFGIDCPERGHVLQMGMFDKMACLFEADGQRPLWRHDQSGLADQHLIIRAPMNLGNYDYIIEWQFYYDGRVETLISASGYLFGAFWDSNDRLVDGDKSTTAFGYRVGEYILGPIHDHAFSFKVDLDILGINNSFQSVQWKAGDVLSALQTQTSVVELPGYFHVNKTRYITHEIIEKESGFVLDPQNPKYYTVVNEDKKNIWGVHRGYRLIPHTTAAEQFTDHVMMPAWEHLKYNVMVTKHKDSEQDATASWYDMTQPGKPFKGVGKMMDGESIRNEDVTLWVTERFLHAPTSEDVPMTLQVTRGFTLKPYNYFDQTPTFDVQGHYGNSDPYPIKPCLENV